MIRYHTLDQWRGVAVLAVLIFHGFGSISGGGLTVHSGLVWLQKAAGYGWLGAHMFFVISGFCISANLAALVAKNGGYMEFAFNRLLRIYPVYWAACLTAILVNLLASPFNRVPITASLPKSWGEAWANLFLVEPYFGYDPLLLVSWSLVYEVGFYLLVAFGLCLYERGVPRVVLLSGGFGLALLAMMAPWKGIFVILNFWPEFVLGTIVYLGLQAAQSSVKEAYLWMTASFPLLLTGIFTLPTAGHKWQLAAVIFFAWMLFLLYPFDRRISKLKIMRGLGWLGVISYSLYLTHVFLGLKLVNLSTRFMDHDSLWMLALQPAAWGLSIVLAWTFYRCVEKPLEKWRKKLSTKLFQNINSAHQPTGT